MREKRLFSLSTDPYLCDHRIDGTPFVPLAVLAEELLGRVPEPEGCCAFRGLKAISLKNPVMLRKNRDRELFINRLGSRVALEGDAGDEYISAEISGEVSEVEIARSSEVPPGGDREPFAKLSREEAYPDLLFHGSTFQGDFSFCRSSGNVVWCRITGIVSDGGSFAGFDPEAGRAIVPADLALQAGGLIAMARMEKAVSPWGCRAYHRASRIPPGIAEVYVKIEEAKRAFTLSTFQANGDMILAWDGLEFREMHVPLSGRALEIIRNLNV